MKDIDFASIGNRIREARKKAKLTQEQLAEMVDTSKTTIGTIENGGNTNGGSVDLFVKIAIALNISLDSLFEIEAAQSEISIPNEKKFKTIKDFIEISDADFNMCYDPHSEYICSLELKSLEISFYLQELFESRQCWTGLDNKKCKDKVKELIDKDFDETMCDKFTFEGNSLVYRKASMHLECGHGETFDELKIYEKVNFTPALDDDGIPF